MHDRILGLDVGDIRIGVAVSDALGMTAQAVATIQRKGLEQDLKGLKALCDEYGARRVVIGYPLNMDGSIGPQAEKIRIFANALTSRLELPSVLWDERLTTAEARKVLISGGMRREKRKDVIDQVAAILILQSYLDAQSLLDPPPDAIV